MLKLIVADDELQILSGIVSIIKSLNVVETSICTAENGFEVMSLLDSGYRPDLIITDIYMPGMNGISMIAEIRKQNIDCDIAILSGFEDFNFAQQALRNNVLDYILKPVDKNQLADLLLKVENKTRQKNHESILAKLREVMLYDLACDDLLIDSGSLSSLLPGAFLMAVSIVSRQEAGPVPLEGAIMETLDSQCKWLWVETNNKNHRVLLVNMPGLPDDAAVAMFELNLAERDRSGGNFDFGLSKITDRLGDLHKLYISSLNAVFCNSALPDAFASERIRTDAYGYTANSGRFFEILDEAGGKLSESVIHYARYRMKCRSADLFYIRLVYIEIMSLIAVYVNSSGISFDRCYLFLKNMGNNLAEINSADEMVEILARDIAQMEGMAVAFPTNSETIVNTIKQYIQENCTRDISLETVADLVHLHPNYVSSLYKRQTGMTFIQYLHHVRIDKAMELILRNPELAVDKAGILTGYDNSSHFFKVFKKLTGITPGQFREKNRKPS